MPSKMERCRSEGEGYHNTNIPFPCYFNGNSDLLPAVRLNERRVIINARDTDVDR